MDSWVSNIGHHCGEKGNTFHGPSWRSISFLWQAWPVHVGISSSNICSNYQSTWWCWCWFQCIVAPSRLRHGYNMPIHPWPWMSFLGHIILLLSWGSCRSWMGWCFSISLLTSWHGRGVRMGLHHLHACELPTIGARLWGLWYDLLTPCVLSSLLWHRYSGMWTSGWKTWRIGGMILLRLHQILFGCSLSQIIPGIIACSLIWVWCYHHI